MLHAEKQEELTCGRGQEYALKDTSVHSSDYEFVDERRIAHLMSKFSTPEASSSGSSSGSRGMTTAAAAGSSSSGGKTVSSKTEPVYAGGIFSRLEAQFRAQQAAKALALQGTQTRYV